MIIITILASAYERNIERKTRKEKKESVSAMYIYMCVCVRYLRLFMQGRLRAIFEGEKKQKKQRKSLHPLAIDP